MRAPMTITQFRAAMYQLTKPHTAAVHAGVWELMGEYRNASPEIQRRVSDELRNDLAGHAAGGVFCMAAQPRVA